MTRPRVIIVGGGIGGLCLAHGLAAKGIPFTLFERDANAEARAQGYRLTIDEVGSSALRACLPRNNYEFIRATSGFAKKEGAFAFLDNEARELHRFTFDLEDVERRGNISGQVDRSTLRKALLSGLGGNIRFGKVFTRYETAGNCVIAHFADGESLAADLIVGADGTNSRVRQQSISNAEPRETGVFGIYGRVPIDRVELSKLGQQLANAGVMAMGPRGRVFFCTAMRFRELPEIAAPRFGVEGGNWPHEDYFMWAVAVREHDVQRGSEGDPTALQSIALQAMSGFHRDCSALVGATIPDSLFLVPVRIASALKTRAPDRVTFIGDAIHAMPPFGAHGANTALKDAQSLSCWLSAAVDTPSLMKMVGEYESEMRRRTSPVIRSSSRMMRMATANFPLKDVVIRTAFRVASKLSFT